MHRNKGSNMLFLAVIAIPMARLAVFDIREVILGKGFAATAYIINE
jgi:hypothetical protein